MTKVHRLALDIKTYWLLVDGINKNMPTKQIENALTFRGINNFDEFVAYYKGESPYRDFYHEYMAIPIK
jgi:hypothetical protein